MIEFPGLRNHWYIACRAGQLRRKPRKLSLFGQKIVLFRGADGKPSALRDLCPHRNAPLSSGRVVAGRLVCPYHGWQFDGEGICQLVPGLCGEQRHRTRNALIHPVIEQQGFVWVYGTPDEKPANRPYHIPYLAVPGYRSLVMDFDITAQLPDALENFLDATHTHFVHGGLVRREGQRKRVSVCVRSYHDRVEAQYIEKESQESGLISRLFGGGIDGSTDRFLLPSIAQLEHRAKGQVKFLMTMIVTPETSTGLRVHVVGSGRSGLFRYLQARVIGKPLLSHVMAQDRDILRLQWANRREHPFARYCYTKADLMMPHIMRLLKRKTLHTDEGKARTERKVELLI